MANKEIKKITFVGVVVCLLNVIPCGANSDINVQSQEWCICHFILLKTLALILGTVTFNTMRCGRNILILQGPFTYVAAVNA